MMIPDSRKSTPILTQVCIHLALDGPHDGGARVTAPAVGTGLMGNGGSSFVSSIHSSFLKDTIASHQHKYHKDESAEPKSQAIHIVGTVTKVVGDELIRAPFGGEIGVASQVSIYKNDGYPMKNQMEFLFAGSEAFRFEVLGHSAEKGATPPTEPVRYVVDGDMSKVIFKLKQTHCEQYIVVDKKSRRIKSHEVERTWEKLVERPDAKLFWDHHSMSSKKGESAMLRAMLMAPIPVPRLAKERVLKLGDTVSVFGQLLENGDGSFSIRPVDEKPVVVCNSEAVAKGLGFKKYPSAESIAQASADESLTVIPMGTLHSRHSKLVSAPPTPGSTSDPDPDLNEKHERDAKMKDDARGTQVPRGARDPLMAFGF